MRISEASKKKNFERFLSSLPSPIAELAADVAAVSSSKTSMTVFATVIAKMLKEMFDGQYGRISPDLAEIFAEDQRPEVMRMADWAASVGNVWKDGEISFPSLRKRAQEWHDLLADNANETAQYSFPDETVLDLGNGWRIVKIDPRNAETEGSIMGHCFGRYGDALKSGSKIGFSIRDANNRPHVTFDVKSLRTRDETVEQAQMALARERAKSMIGRRFQEEVPVDTPNYVQAIADFFGSGEYGSMVEKLAIELVERGDISLYELNEVEAKGNTPPPDKYRGIISKFLADNGYVVNSLSLRDKLTPSDELLNRMSDDDNVADIVWTAHNAIPANKREEAIKLIFDNLEDPTDISWMAEESDAYYFLKLLTDEASQNPKNDWIKDLLAETIKSNPFLLYQEDTEYLVEDIYDALGGDKWLSSLLSSPDVNAVEAGISAIQALGFDNKPEWSRIMSNAIMKIAGETDTDLPAPKMEDFEDPIEALKLLDKVGVQRFYNPVDIFSQGPVGEKLFELYSDRPADIGPYLEQIPWRVLKGLHKIPEESHPMSQLGLFHQAPRNDPFAHERQMNKRLEDMAKSQIERGQKAEEREEKLQPQLFQLACLLDEENPKLADDIDKHLLRRGS